MSLDVNIYCDESRHSNPTDPYLVIGAIRFTRADKDQVVRAIRELKRDHNIGAEFGWKQASWNRAQFYWDLIDWFATTEEVSFRCVVAEKSRLWSARPEDGFYVVYHQLLSHWLKAPATYHIYLDRKTNSRTRRVDELRRRTLRDLPKESSIACMEEVESRECVPIQLADFLIGCVGYEWCGHRDRRVYPTASTFKGALCEHLAASIGKPTLRHTTWAGEPKFNVFAFGE